MGSTTEHPLQSPQTGLASIVKGSFEQVHLTRME